MRVLILTIGALLGSAPLVPLTAVAQANAGQDSAKAVNVSLYMITFVEPGVLYNKGQRSGYASTALEDSGSRKLNAQRPEVIAWRDFLNNQQDNYLAAMDAAVARKINVIHRYDISFNGVSAELTEAEAAQVRALPGVKSVEADKIYELNTDAGPAFIGAPAIWDGTQTYSTFGTRGQGVVVGVFDSGGNSDHPSFANDASCGFSVANPKLLGTKDCNTTNCATGDGEDNSIFVDTVNTGSSGHGVHTASTAVGVPIAEGTLVNGVPARFNISGVAPCAKVITYKTCGSTAPSGAAGCSGAAIAAAIQTSIVDQVDVVNFSISGGTTPWTDNDRGFLDMFNADILVAASSGNTRTATPNPIGAVNHRGPWVLTVANSTHDREVTNPVSVAGSLQNVPSGASNGLAFTTTVTAEAITGASLGNEFGCTDLGGFAPSSMTGKLALIQRGPLAPGVACGFVEKINNATAAGAVGVVIYNHSPGAPLTMDVSAAPGTTVPAVFIRQAAGVALRDFLNGTPNAEMTIVGPSVRVIDPGLGDVLNASSLRGPNATFDVTKPDITGPGTNIYAASSGNFGEFIFLTGTSMSSPHLAGAAALLRSSQPSWTAAEVKSAIMLTAVVPGRIQDEVTPWNPDDVGNGRIDLNRAARSGLVMNETFANFLAANPSNGNANLPRQLNLPSMRHTSIAGSYTFTRTFRNAYGKAVTWTADTTGAPAGSTVTVLPNSFTFGNNVGQTQTVQITVTLTSAQAALTFGDVLFTPVLVVDPDVVFASGMEDVAQPPYAARLTIATRGNP
jgi:subtilisin family serine protease